MEIFGQTVIIWSCLPDDEITPRVESMSLKDKKSKTKSNKGYNQADYKETTKKKGSLKKKR